jgi:hypothetical protein
LLLRWTWLTGITEHNGEIKFFVQGLDLREAAYYVLHRWRTLPVTPCGLRTSGL